MIENSNRLPEEKTYPFYIKAPVILFGLVLFFYVLHLLSSVLVPFAFAILLAMLLNPLASRLQRTLPRGIAIFITIFAAIILVGVIIYLLSTQILT